MIFPLLSPYLTLSFFHFTHLTIFLITLCKSLLRLSIYFPLHSISYKSTLNTILVHSPSHASSVRGYRICAAADTTSDSCCRRCSCRGCCRRSCTATNMLSPIILTFHMHRDPIGSFHNEVHHSLSLSLFLIYFRCNRTFATNMRDNGVDKVTVSRILSPTACSQCDLPLTSLIAAFVRIVCRVLKSDASHLTCLPLLATPSPPPAAAAAAAAAPHNRTLPPRKKRSPNHFNTSPRIAISIIYQ